MNSSILLARQPIFDRDLNTVAYELLYRSPEGHGPAAPFNGTAATAQVLMHAYSSIFHDGKVKTIPAFINFNADWIYNGELPALKPEALVLEILEDVPVTPELESRMQHLNAAGYRLALDDFIYDQSWDNALKSIQVVKIDIQQLSPAQLIRHLDELKQHNVTLLAEKIETHLQFEYCKSLGFKLFQGYFFCRPQMVEGRSQQTNGTNTLRLIAELERADVAPADLEAIINKDPELVLRLLKIVNSARFALSRKISNISEAIIAIGLNELKKWVMLIGVTQSQVQTNELIREVLARAKFCELIAKNYQTQPNTAFMLGLLSGMDALLNLPMDDLLDQIAVADEVQQALLNHEGNLGVLLDDAKNFMTGEWEQLEHQSESEILAAAYSQSLSWVMETMQDLHNL